MLTVSSRNVTPEDGFVERITGISLEAVRSQGWSRLVRSRDGPDHPESGRAEFR